ncbi:glycosyl hydrolase family 10 [Pontibacter ummariensis]|uniref:Glycosyl hydrolase-like 10 n=1 Tax=Pontibacter ummariensis TaxID=1610492 RepID=A0A239G4B6_9BACT|nr:family 10 glycosylhydrolase [Pontibacter ummariensis]PRY11687.1 glycosyl hydrolase family 10 [Pontibacter ummariensis]SNS62884.1 Glycosyl hydrolase-like 10 [Pontibacter ummariensis]
MKTRRTFLKTSVLAGLSASLPVSAMAAHSSPNKKKAWKHWVWVNPDHADKAEELQQRYKRYYEAGIRGIFFEEDSEKHFRAAKAQKLEAHRWMWTMNRGEKELLKEHPEWYAINRKGESCADKPPYVNYYRWLCPSRTEVQQYLEDDVRNILSKDYVDGIHLDYVRFCDVILPVNLWENYKIEQTKELPEYDYCYCEVCRTRFKEWRGEAIESIAYPEASLSWRLFRYNAISNVVNKLAVVAKDKKKAITAAVFPTPEVARRIVRQDWTNWNLDGVCPMIYHGFYKEDVRWIGDAVTEGVHFLAGRFPLYAGIFLPDFKSNTELQQGMEYAMRNGAGGISLFGKVTDEVLTALERASAAVKV